MAYSFNQERVEPVEYAHEIGVERLVGLAEHKRPERTQDRSG